MLQDLALIEEKKETRTLQLSARLELLSVVVDVAVAVVMEGVAEDLIEATVKAIEAEEAG